MATKKLERSAIENKAIAKAKARSKDVLIIEAFCHPIKCDMRTIYGKAYKAAERTFGLPRWYSITEMNKHKMRQARKRFDFTPYNHRSGAAWSYNNYNDYFKEEMITFALRRKARIAAQKLELAKNERIKKALASKHLVVEKKNKVFLLFNFKQQMRNTYIGCCPIISSCKDIIKYDFIDISECNLNLNIDYSIENGWNPNEGLPLDYLSTI